MRKVEFIKDFANKLKGETGEFDSQLASHLVRVDKVAKYYVELKKKVLKKKK